MISEAHSEAARINGAKSYGPKTPEGKVNSSANSLRHGMTAKAILLTYEEPKAYCQLAEGYYARLRPTDDVERDIIDQMIISKWLQRRDWSNEAALFDLEMDDQTKKVNVQFPKIDPASRYAMAFKALADGSKAIQLFIRYQAAHERAYYKALDTLLKLRAQPKPEPIENEDCETNPGNESEKGTNDEETPPSNESPEASPIEPDVTGVDSPNHRPEKNS
jgi:hypothetical protein